MRVTLGRIGPAPVSERRDRRGEVLYLPKRDQVVVIDHPELAGRWAATRILWGGRDREPRQIILTEADLEQHSTTTIDVERNERGRYLAVWVLKIWQRLGALDADHARRMVVELLPDLGLILTLDDAASERFCRAANLRTYAYTAILTRLCQHEYLVHLATESPYLYLITIPDSDVDGENEQDDSGGMAPDDGDNRVGNGGDPGLDARDQPASQR